MKFEPFFAPPVILLMVRQSYGKKLSTGHDLSVLDTLNTMVGSYGDKVAFAHPCANSRMSNHRRAG